MKFDKEISSGGVVYAKEENQIKVALIVRGGGKIWCLPKGKIEKDESPDAAALREVKEETGLDGEIEKKLGDITYWYYSKENDTKYFKTVSFYLLRHTGGSAATNPEEAEECRWFPILEALKSMSYKSECEIVEKAKKLLC
ncbi:MAG: NUDIX hydrolase [Candidatus Omnitrophota bacterium]